jgi:hypothetical protein
MEELELKKFPAIRTRQLELEDANGNLRALLATTGEGHAALRFMKPGSQSSLEISMLNTGAPGIMMRDLKGSRRLTVELTESGDAQIGLFDRERNPRIVITVTGENDTVIAVKDASGAIRDGTFVMADGSCSRKG